MRRLALIVLLAAVATGCARQGYPTGGPKDTQPPTAVGTRPVNESRSFAAKQFYVEFDEYVVLKNADANVLVSPPMAQKPEFSIKGKGVLVRIKDTLPPNTTYLFQFKEAIADFTEGNVLPSFEYVFSTGEAMDTLMLAGRVERARDGKPWPEGVAVSAFREGDTLPAFVTRADQKGNYAFHYIPAGRYRLVAMEDKNKNWLPDSTEAVAWDTTYFAAVDSIDSTQLATLRISTPDRQRQRVLKAEMPARGRVVVSTLLPMERPHIDGEAHEWRLNGRGDSLTVWLMRQQADSTLLVLRDRGLDDTLKLRYRAPSKKGRTAGLGSPKEPPLVSPLCDGTRAFYDSLMLAFSTPVARMAEGASAWMMHLKDSTVQTAPIVLDSGGMKARIVAQVKSGEDYRVRLTDSLFYDIYGRPSDSLNFKMTPKDYGTLTLRIDNRTGSPLVIEVLDAKDTVVQTGRPDATGVVRFSHLAAGDYRIRAVVDRDSNGRWTTGDYLAGRQPEPFLLFDKTLQLREKWEMEEQWKVTLEKPARKTLTDMPRRLPAGGFAPGRSIGQPTETPHE